MKLTRAERWLLANQFAILAKLYPEESDRYETMREVIENGYELNYDWISTHIYEHVMTEEECREVLHILDMFYFLKWGYEDLTDQSAIDPEWLEFRGFDSTTETAYMAYARFLIERKHQYVDIGRGDDFNSHVPVIDIYRRMLRRWEESFDKHHLTKEDLIRITSV